MKLFTPELAWHNRDPISSLDIQSRDSNDGVHRIATSGSDGQVLIWRYRVGNKVEPVSQLTRHEAAVNVVRFTPNGTDVIASGDVNGNIIIWKREETEEVYQPKQQKNKIIPTNNSEDSDSVQELDPEEDTKSSNQQGNGFEEDLIRVEVWKTDRTLRGHVEDVVDVSWSQNGSCLVSGSVDNDVIVWDAVKGQQLHRLHGHKSWVQGVTWDPLNQFVATLATDRTLRVFSIQTQKMVIKMDRATLKFENQPDIKTRLFYDYTMPSTTRRLAFSPGGELLFVPSGVIEYPKEKVDKKGKDLEVVTLDSGDEASTNDNENTENKVNNTVSNGQEGATPAGPTVKAETPDFINACHIFSRNDVTKPIAILPTGDKFCHAVRCCPTKFELRDAQGTKTPYPFPYRLLFAVATQDSVLLYDTEQTDPVGYITDIHYTRISDMSWSKDGTLFMISSTDGFCTFVTFDQGNLGIPYLGDNYVFEAVAPSPKNGSTPVKEGAKGKRKRKKQEIPIEGDPSTGDGTITPESLTQSGKKSRVRSSKGPKEVEKEESPVPKTVPLSGFFKPITKEERFDEVRKKLQQITTTPKSKRKDPENGAKGVTKKIALFPKIDPIDLTGDDTPSKPDVNLLMGSACIEPVVHLSPIPVVKKMEKKRIVPKMVCGPLSVLKARRMESLGLNKIREPSIAGSNPGSLPIPSPDSVPSGSSSGISSACSSQESVSLLPGKQSPTSSPI